MNDDWLASELEALEESAPVASSPGRPAASRPRQRLALLAAAVVIGAVLVAAVVAALSDRGQPIGEATSTPTPSGEASASAEPIPTPASSPSPTVVPTAGPFSVVTDSDPWNGDVPRAVVDDAVTGQWLALSGADVWTSADGETWRTTTIEHPDCAPPNCKVSLADVLRINGHWVAYGALASTTSDSAWLGVWESANGDSWVPLNENGTPASQGISVAARGSTVVIAGADLVDIGGIGLIQMSTDGVNWKTDQPIEANTHDVYGDAAGFVVVGEHLEWQPDTLQNRHTPVVATSQDGESWTVATGVPDVEGGLYAIDRMADGTYVALGTSAAGAVMAWTSSDAAEWSMKLFTGAGVAQLSGNFPFHHLATADAGAIAIVNADDGARAWGTADGVDWYELDRPRTATGKSAYAWSIGADDAGRFIAFGSTRFFPTVEEPPVENVRWSIVLTGGQ